MDSQPTSDVKYPHIAVQLTGQDGNAFNLLNIVIQAMKRNDVSNDECNAFMSEATSGNYDQLLATCMKWVNAS